MWFGSGIFLPFCVSGTWHGSLQSSFVLVHVGALGGQERLSQGHPVGSTVQVANSSCRRIVGKRIKNLYVPCTSNLEQKMAQENSSLSLERGQANQDNWPLQGLHDTSKLHKITRYMCLFALLLLYGFYSKMYVSMSLIFKNGI